MQMTDEVRAALQTLKVAAENDFERLTIERLEIALTNPPKVEIVDETHQKFNGLMYYKDKKRGYYYECTGIHQAVWRYYCGDIPFDFNIHHVSGDKDDNDISNLQMKSRARPRTRQKRPETNFHVRCLRQTVRSDEQRHKPNLLRRVPNGEKSSTVQRRKRNPSMRHLRARIHDEQISRPQNLFATLRRVVGTPKPP